MSLWRAGPGCTTGAGPFVCAPGIEGARRPRARRPCAASRPLPPFGFTAPHAQSPACMAPAPGRLRVAGVREVQTEELGLAAGAGLRGPRLAGPLAPLAAWPQPPQLTRLRTRLSPAQPSPAQPTQPGSAQPGSAHPARLSSARLSPPSPAQLSPARPPAPQVLGASGAPRHPGDPRPFGGSTPGPQDPTPRDTPSPLNCQTPRAPPRHPRHPPHPAYSISPGHPTPPAHPPAPRAPGACAGGRDLLWSVAL
jgi:hypothetical protein